MVIAHAYPTRCQYKIDDIIMLAIRLINTELKDVEVNIRITCYNLHEELFRNTFIIKMNENQKYSDHEIKLENDPLDIGGYSLKIDARGGGYKDSYLTAMDVVKNSLHSVRLIECKRNSKSPITLGGQLPLVKYHFNYVIMEGHGLYKPYLDLLGTGIKILGHIQLHKWWENFNRRHKKWKIFGKRTTKGVPLEEFLDQDDYQLQFLNRMCMKKLMDQQGLIVGVSLNIEGEDFENITTKVLTTIKKIPLEIFICRDYYWPIKNYDIEEQEVLILQVKQPFCTYYQIKNIILEGKYFSQYKPVIIKAMLGKRDYKNGIYQYKLLYAAVVANGAALYYRQCDIEEMGRELERYFHFTLQYKEFFYDDNVSELSKSYYSYRDKIVEYVNFEFSIAATSDKVWFIIKESSKHLFMSLINLKGNTNEWMSKKNAPKKLKNLKFRLPIRFGIKDIHVDSPDQEHRVAKSIPFNIARENKEYLLEFTVPELKIWNLVYITKSESETISS